MEAAKQSIWLSCNTLWRVSESREAQGQDETELPADRAQEKGTSFRAQDRRWGPAQDDS